MKYLPENPVFYLCNMGAHLHVVLTLRYSFYLCFHISDLTMVGINFYLCFYNIISFYYFVPQENQIINCQIDCIELLDIIKLSVPTRSQRYYRPIAVPSSSTNYRQNSFIVRASVSLNMMLDECG
ncbi:unnamed protein product [Diatraea saccharalis]|uniref:Uncharacterized protein n=1 Tax=Diatraea saccharalis TaxID=40085 RepID=A0A9N9RFP7_9NEOP|nr:unnamed protein product [Diatraea saccharalis]